MTEPGPTRTFLDASCYGCVHLRYKGSSSVRSVKDMTGGTAIPLREHDAHNGPGRYECAKLGRVVCQADERPKELEPGCKETR